MMPKMNGLEVLKTIRDKENLIPILMLLLSKRAIEPVAESYEKQMKTTMIEFPFSEVISEEAQSFQGLAKVKGKNIILSVYNTSQPLTKENIDQRFDSKRWKMLQIGTFFIRIYEKNITKWFTYEKWGSKLEVVGKKWN